jgi:hypothetical protein
LVMTLVAASCWSNCKSLSSISFESNSGLTQIESFAFSYSLLQSLLIPRNVQFIDGCCFCINELPIERHPTANIYSFLFHSLNQEWNMKRFMVFWENWKTNHWKMNKCLLLKDTM